MFPAKLLLFGEYTLLHGSMALSVPFRQYYGEWAFSGNPPEKFHNTLSSFYDYLNTTVDSGSVFNIDLDAYKKDIYEGIYFNSTIPAGYGVGSSGAFCAGFYSRYAFTPIPPNSSDMMLPSLRKHLSQIESFFHGTSSGIDPLVSYTNSPILIDANGLIKRQKNLVSKHFSIFLLNTGMEGDTGKNVKLFKDMMKDDLYAASVRNHYIPLVNKCITRFIEGENVFPQIEEISFWQQELFEHMIPANYYKYFRKEEHPDHFVLKLCGSGGGGFVMGFSRDMVKTSEYFKNENVNLIVVTL